MRTTSPMALPSFLARILLSLTHLTAAQTDNGNECSCFRTNGSSKGYFTYHRFHDFRNVAGASPDPPTVAPNASSASNAFATSDFFLSSTWTSDWTTQNWNNSDSIAATDASILMINSPNNVYIESSSDPSTTSKTYLTLRTSRLPTFQSAAEIDSTEKNFQYLSLRVYARVIGSPGACAGLFTYLPSPNSNTQLVQEADIEILTSGPRDMVQYTNQPSQDSSGNPLPAATVNSTNPGGRDWTTWNTYRLDWMPKMSAWYVNGISVANISFQAPRDPSSLLMNMWSDGGSWTGNMSLYDEAYLQIQWIEVVYNTSGPYAGSRKGRRDADVVLGGLLKRKGTPGCKVVCGVDEKVNVTGTPALLYNNTGMAPGRGDGMGYLGWIPVVLVGGALFGYL